jgi:hypothetical protein
VITTRTGRYDRQISREEQQIYDHLLHWVELETPDELIDRFHALFIEGSRYPDPAITQALDTVTLSRTATEEFRFVLNRCCHILINRWQSRFQSQLAIPKLIELFKSIPSPYAAGIHRSRSIARLRELTKLFTETDQYITLCRLAQVLSQGAEAQSAAQNRSLGSLIRRYPYLYEHCLLSEESVREQQSTVRQIQANVQRQFEIDLSQYVTYQVRRSHLVSQPLQTIPDRIIQPVPNPTLLADRELGVAIKHYIGRVDGTNTQRDLACTFLTHSRRSTSYKAFKDDLYEYIVAGIDPEYGKRQFNKRLYAYLSNISPDSSVQPLNDFLIVRTYNQLLNFLVVDNPQNSQHFIFIDLITNLGPILTTGLLLKIVLCCRKVKPCLERRFSILFSHYETYNREAVQWLVNALEHLNIALSTNFGAIDLSIVR